jgi:hypothetical protein
MKTARYIHMIPGNPPQKPMHTMVYCGYEPMKMGRLR